MRKVKSGSWKPRPKITVAQDQDDSSCSDDILARASSHDERRTLKYERSNMLSPIDSYTDTSTSMSDPSLTTAIDRYRTDFEDIKCKMRIFGESLNLCRCIAFDFKNKVSNMDKRLKILENRQDMSRSQNNYSAIITKNKALSTKTLKDAKKLQMCGTENEMREVAGRICKNYLHGAWKTVEASDLVFSKICGGLSNFLYYVALPDEAGKWEYARRDPAPDYDDRTGSCGFDEPKKVLLRIYGQVHGERAMDAIVTESVIFTLLSERRLGPKLHGVFSGGRIEEYIPGRPLLTKELSEPALSMKIAEKTAAIHSMDVPLSKEPNWLWKTMAKWLKTVKEERLAPSNKGRNEEEQQIIRRLKVIDFDSEIEWLRKFLSTVESPVVFCHNDLQEGNILLLEDDLTTTTTDDYVSSYVQTYNLSPKSSKEKKPLSLEEKESRLSISDKILSTERVNTPQTRAAFMDGGYEDTNTSDSHISDSGEPKLVLIDFEYCAYNYRGFDIANHFQEWGFDYTNPQHPFYFENQENCPTLEQKEIFIREYLKHYTASLSDSKPPSAAPIDAVNRLLHEVDAFALASHLFWCLWAAVNAGKSQIPFGYWEYALSRLETYFQLKQEVVKGDAANRPPKRKICEVDI